MNSDEWYMFDKPSSISRGRKCYGIRPLKMGQLLLCNDGKGFYGYLNTNIKDNLSFTSTLCGNDIDTAKQEVIEKFKFHIKGIKLLCSKQICELEMSLL